jgi:hypothetical protein
MRTASLSYAKQAIGERGLLTTNIDKHIRNTRKSVAAGCLQFKSSHTITGAHLLRIGEIRDARCCWCGENSQTIAYLLLECRKWRRQTRLHAAQATREGSSNQRKARLSRPEYFVRRRGSCRSPLIYRRCRCVQEASWRNERE